jgi:hypothetical protein
VARAEPASEGETMPRPRAVCGRNPSSRSMAAQRPISGPGTGGRRAVATRGDHDHAAGRLARLGSLKDRACPQASLLDPADCDDGSADQAVPVVWVPKTPSNPSTWTLAGDGEVRKALQGWVRMVPAMADNPEGIDRCYEQMLVPDQLGRSPQILGSSGPRWCP